MGIDIAGDEAKGFAHPNDSVVFEVSISYSLMFSFLPVMLGF